MAPLSTPMVARKNEKERTVLSLLDVQSSTDKKLAKTRDTAELLMKRNIVSIEYSVWLLPTRLLTNRDCLLQLCKLDKSAGTVSRKFYLQKPVYIGFTSCG